MAALVARVERRLGRARRGDSERDLVLSRLAPAPPRGLREEHGALMVADLEDVLDSTLRVRGRVRAFRRERANRKEKAMRSLPQDVRYGLDR